MCAINGMDKIVYVIFKIEIITKLLVTCRILLVSFTATLNFGSVVTYCKFKLSITFADVQAMGGLLLRSSDRHAFTSSESF